MPLTPSERVLRAQIAAHASWAKTEDRSQRGAAGIAGLMRRFEREADPNNVLSDEERQLRARSLWKAHFARLALKSAQSRRKAKEFMAEARAADIKLAAGGADVI